MYKLKIASQKISTKIILYPLVLIIAVIIIHFLLELFGLKFRGFVYLTAWVILIFGILIKIIIVFIKQSPRVKRIIGFICGTLVTLGLIFWKLPIILFFLILLIVPNTEHVVERNGQKYIACVSSGFTHTKVYYYDYINFLVMGNKERFIEDYKGSYDPIKREKEENYINKNNVEKNNQNTEESPPSNKYLEEVKDIVDDKDIKDTMFYIKGLPDLKDNKLKLELFAPESTGSKIGNYYKFESIDNGLNWICVK